MYRDLVSAPQRWANFCTRCWASTSCSHGGAGGSQGPAPSGAATAFVIYAPPCSEQAWHALGNAGQSQPDKVAEPVSAPPCSARLRTLGQNGKHQRNAGGTRVLSPGLRTRGRNTSWVLIAHWPRAERPALPSPAQVGSSALTDLPGERCLEPGQERAGPWGPGTGWARDPSQTVTNRFWLGADRMGHGELNMGCLGDTPEEEPGEQLDTRWGLAASRWWASPGDE